MSNGLNDSIWQNDEAVETAMLKSCLLFSGRNIKNNRAIILQKKILSLLIQGKVKDVSDVKEFCFIGETEQIENKELVCESAIKTLQNQKFIDVNTDGSISLCKKTREEADKFVEKFNKNKNTIIEYILQKVKDGYGKNINQQAQVVSNIHKCFEYYFKISSFTFLGYDDHNENIPEKLKEIASKDLNNDANELRDYIIYSIGKLLEEPNSEQKSFLETYARAALTSQIIGTDPLLRNFRQTIIGKKNFVIDTDIVLYCITKNTRKGKEYLKMINRLLSCGCKFYIPQEVIIEAYDHAEAATKRYNYQHYMIENSEPSIIVNNGTNVFIEDYMLDSIKGSADKWKRYIQNYFDSEYGLTLIQDKIKHKLGDKIHYNTYPNNQITLDSSEYRKLHEEIYDLTRKSPNAKFRDEDKNKKIAGVDTSLYLTVKKANLMQMEREGSKNPQSGILCHDYYILTSSTRAHVCAKKLDMDYDVLCSPKAMMAYLSEAGLMNDNDIYISDLFDNPFLIYIAQSSWEDINNIIKAGVDVRGKELVRLRLDLQKNIHALLTTPDSEEFKKAYIDTVDMGYTFNDNIKTIMEESLKKEQENEELKEILRQTIEENKKIKKQLGNKKYQERINQVIKKKK